MRPLTTERLRELLSYDPETGLFTWNISPLVHKWRGRVAGREDNGYCRIRIDRQEYLAHRLAWLYMTGEWPEDSIDHINGTRSDNRWTNLRDVPQSVNMQNRRRPRINSKSGMLGVKWNADSASWEARIKIGDQQIYLGRAKDKTVAAAMYVAAKRVAHIGCTLEPVDHAN
jgi:hypothetical protein